MYACEKEKERDKEREILKGIMREEWESKYERNTSLNLDESKNIVCMSGSEIENELERKNTLYNYERSEREKILEEKSLPNYLTHFYFNYKKWVR